MPTKRDFERLVVALDEDIEGQELKSIILWPGDIQSDKPKRNSSGFTALPAGSRDVTTFADIGSYGYFWTLSEDPANSARAWILKLRYSGDGADVLSDSKLVGYSLRFVK